MLLSERLEAYWNEKPVGLVLDEEQVEAVAKKAIRFYVGYSKLRHYLDTENSHEAAEADPDTLTTESEWAIIRPLFDLYAELENATALEATRGLGVDVYGRATSEIQGDIMVLEESLPYRAFCVEAFTV